MRLYLKKSSTMINSDGHDKVVVQFTLSVLLLLIKEMYKERNIYLIRIIKLLKI